MAITVEVKTGQRRAIEFFLSPLMRYQDEAMRERWGDGGHAQTDAGPVP